MLKTLVASRFAKPMGTGKTYPALIGAQDGEDEIEIVVKFGAGCDLRQRGLVTEAIVALLAADLDLPVPEPFLVTVEADFVATIPEFDERHRETKTRARASIGTNFGSRKLPPGFSAYPKGKRLPSSLLGVAAEVLAFDTFIVNPDRVVANANFLIKGDEMAIYDHELALFMDGLIGWSEPWNEGAIAFPMGLAERQRHVFLEEFRGEPVDLGRLTGAFEAITDARLQEYRSAIPPAWIGDGAALDRMLDYLAALRQNIGPAVQGLKRALQ